MIILGINAYHADAAAALLIDGQLVAAAEEERFKRIKHWAGFPSDAIKYCMREAGVSLHDVDHIAINRNPNANLLRKALFAISKRPSLSVIRDRLSNAGKLQGIKDVLSKEFGINSADIKANVYNVEHHRAHMGSSFFVSPFESSAVVSVDGFGDFVSTMWGVGEGLRLEVRGSISFPHSLGLFYLALTQYLGFPRYGDEYKVMGLAPYGKPTEMEKLRKVVFLNAKGKFELDLDYFVHHSTGVSMVWDNGDPSIGKVYSEKLVELLGPARMKDEPITEYHKDIAASLQEMYEEAFFHLLDHVYSQTKNP
ncbi:MAG: carbamoyltransferase N-terminal domain-containing protein, partial [Nitrospirota bacterium]